MMRSLSLRLILTTAALLLVSHPESRAQNLVFDSSDFASWDHPVGLVNVLSDRVEVKRFGKTFNAVTNADRLSSSIIGDWGLRPVRSPSNQFLARRVADQENGTWWQPDPDDALHGPKPAKRRSSAQISGISPPARPSWKAASQAANRPPQIASRIPAIRS